MRTCLVGTELSVDRWARAARRLGIVAAVLLSVASAWAQSLAVTTLASSGLNVPTGVVADSAGNVYVADTSSHSIKKITSAGVVSTLAGTGTAGSTNSGASSTFNGPRALAINSAGTIIYVADTLNNMIRQITLSAQGGTVSSVTTVDSSMNGPRGITINSSDDTLYVSNLGTASISKIVLSGPTVTTIVNAGLSQPMGLALNAAGTVLYVADASANLIRSVTLSGPTVATYAGNGTAALTDNTTATSASFNNPIGLSIDASDNLYVADTGNHAIRTIAAAGSHAVVTVAGNGTAGLIDATGSAARFSSPNGITVKTISAVQYEFIADTGNNAIRKASLPVAPSVSSPSNQSVLAGATNVTFTAAATAGWPTPTLQWQRNPNGSGIFADVPNTSPYSGATTGTLTISTVTSGMNGDTFRLVATNSTGSASSSVPATLTVSIPPTAPSFATSTVTFNATIGQANTFNTAATSGTTPITYSVSSGSLGIFTLNTSTGVITGNPSSTADSTVVTITASNGTLPNATRTVTINAVITAVPSISTQPQNQTVTAGASTATFSVSATGSPSITGYQWERQAGGSGSFVAITDGASTGATFSGATTATLSLSNVTPAANGDVYRVQITNSVGTTQSSTATLTVQGTAPQIGTTPSSTSADAGTNATFTATATGNPSPTIRWQRQAAGTSGFVDLSDGGSYSGTATTTLTVSSVSAGMNGDQFRLSATNIYGVTNSGAATLTINSLVPLISVAPQNTTVNIAQNATFTASATGNPSPSLRWQRQPAGTFGFVDLSDDATYSGTTGNTLTVISPTAGMNGDQFRVVATNTNGSTPSSSATLTVSSSAPTVTTNPTSVIANIGQQVTFSGNATGNPSPGFRWQRQAFGTTGFVDLSDDGTYSGTAATQLTIAAVTAGMTGDQFRLVASNAGGSTPTNAATLTVNLGTTFTTFAGTPNFPGAVDATGTAARFSSPAAIAVDSSGNFYIADTGNSIIRKMTSNGVVTTLAGTAGSRGSVDGTGAAARFNSPTGIAVDGVGNVYVSDTFNHTIRTITPAGVVTTLAGSPNSSGAVNDVGSAARFFLPAGIVVTPNGTLYVADSSNHAIRRITTDGTVTTFVGGLGVPGFVDASGLSARFNAPNAIALDSSGNLYVADSQNNAIRKVTTGGSVSTFAGSLVGTIGSADGTGTAATFNRPSGISVDSSGYVYVADTNNNILRKITPSGEVTILAGLAGVFGSADGVGTAARFNRPFGIVVDANSNIYVADTGNHIIRRSGSTVAVVITGQPTNQGAAIGQNVSFSVTATGTPTPTAYQWQREAAGTSGFVNLGSSSTYSGVTTSTLTITNVNSAMQGDRFRVVVANGVNPAATSDAATLSIGTPVNFTSANAATFQAGISNSFTVTTDSASGVTFSATGLPSWATINSSTGVLSGTPPDTTGSPLTITLIANNGVPATQTFTLTISPANLPATIASQPANAAVNPGATATFTVGAGGSAPFTYQWRRNGINLAGATDPTLTLANVQAANAGTYTVVVTNVAGSATSAGATLTVNTVPVITAQPRPQVSILGGGATFSVAATGSNSFTYQWRKNGVAIAGANGDTLTLSGLTTADAANYDVIVTDASGSTISSLAQLTFVTAASTPVITLQPANRTVVAGTPVTLAAAATGAPSPTFQWRRNGAPIGGAVSPTLSFANVQTGDAANYDVVVTNSAGSVTSVTVGLRVLTRSSAGVYFGNLSNGLGNFAMYVRDDNTGVFLAYLPGSTAPIVSLNLTVTDSGQFSFSQNAVGSAGLPDEPARAAALAPVTVTGTIAADGTITGTVGGGANALLTGAKASDTGPTQGLAGFYQAGATNGSASAYTIVGGTGQAFVVVQSGANSDGGVATITNAGQISLLTSRSVIAETINAATGVITGSSAGAVVAPALTGASDVALSRQRLINISSRARVGTGDAVAIAGFVISGQESKPVLIRAVGPTLGAAPFNLTGALASPKLELFRGSTSIGSNTGIGTNRAAIDAAGAQVGAFALGAAGTDAAIVTTLAPGNYTAIVSSTTNTGGVALIEVYDLSGASAGQKLLNISTRASAGTAENTLIAGFVVPPGAAKRVLVRGVGPGLTPLGVTGALANPILAVLSGSTVISQNTNWTTSTDAALITTSSAQVGAFGLSNNDSAVILTLAPGNYTAQVTGVGGTTGVALIEVYELP